LRRAADVTTIYRPLEVLLVEDNPGDVRLTKEATRGARISNNLSVARSGEEAIAFLRRDGGFAAAARPDIIILDLNLPRKNGQQVLAEIKADERIRRIPVVILTTSSAQRDIVGSYDLHANCYITKPLELEEFTHVINVIEGFWLSMVQLPNE
jgi:CheY-like chemotaxis protein